MSRPDGVERREESFEAQPSTDELRLRDCRLLDEFAKSSSLVRRDADPCLVCLVRVVAGVWVGVGVGVVTSAVGGVNGSGETSLSLSLERF